MSFFSSLFYGFGAAFCALLAQQLIPQSMITNLYTHSTPTTPLLITGLFVVLALIEEGCKCAVITFACDDTTPRADRIRHAVIIGTVFFVSECAAIVVGVGNGTFPALTQLLGIALVHGTTPLWYALTPLWRFWSSYGTISIVLIVAILLHTSYNLLTFAGYGPLAAPQMLLLGGIACVTIFLIGTTRVQSPR